MVSIACVNCGKRLPPGHRFCGFCGTAAGGASVEPVDKPKTQVFQASTVTSKARLVVIRGSGGDITAYSLNADQQTCGREFGTIIFPDDNTVSPTHASFFFRGGRLFCRDLNSANGTYIRVRKRVPLNHGDRFLCGEQLFEYNQFPESTDTTESTATNFCGTPKLWPWTYQITQVLTGGRYGEVRSAAEANLSIGREHCDLNFASDPFISQYHARIVRLGKQHFLEDTQSKNGTFYSVRSEFGLENGDTVFVGRQLLRVDIQ